MQKRIRFENRAGISLSAVLHTPDIIQTKAYALYAHCFTCTKSIKAAVTIATILERQGIATLRIDFTGLGGSKGDFADSNFSTDVADLIDAANYLANNHHAPQLLIGHSLGGTAILAAASDISSAKAVVSIGSPAKPSHILHLLEEHLNTLRVQGQAEVKLAGRPFSFKQSFVDDVSSNEVDYRNLRKALMVMHAPLDDTVSVDEAGKIFAAAMHPKSFVSLDGADHLLNNTQDAEYAANVIANWADRYIEPLAIADDVDQGVTVTGNTQQGFLCKVEANGHRFAADEPLSFGGTNLGPSPYDYLAAALGTCTVMTLNMYARHKKIKLESASVNVQHQRVHVKDCEECESQTKKVDQLTRVIHLKGELSEAQQKRMLEIADRCPVHKTLENDIQVVSQFANEP